MFGHVECTRRGLIMRYFSLSLYPIDFKPWHNDPEVKSCAITFLRYISCSAGFIQVFLVYYVDQWWYIDVHVGRSPWILAGQYKGPSSEVTGPACPLWSPSTFNQLKYRGLYPIMFQCGPSVAEGCPNQHWVFDTNSRTFQMLQINIEITVAIASNTKRRRNVVLMFGQRHRQ